MGDRVFTAEEYDNVWRIRFTPPKRRDEEGGVTTFGLSFPMLAITDWCANPDKIAQAVADVLEDNRDKFLGDPGNG